MQPIIYAGVAADRNDRAMLGAVELGTAISHAHNWNTVTVSEHRSLVAGGWRQQLEYARPCLDQLAVTLGSALNQGPTLLFAGRCAASIATLPQVASRHPDAVVVWFDAHGDCNVPTQGSEGEAAYLGGMVISAAAGAWDSGLGSGLKRENVILVGSRDLDPPEQARIESGQLKFVSAGPDIGDRLIDVIGDRPVYIHLDCDVLEAGLLATEYQVKGGLEWQDLADAFQALARCDIIGLEVAEYESTWPDGRQNDPALLHDAIKAVIATMGLVAR